MRTEEEILKDIEAKKVEYKKVENELWKLQNELDKFYAEKVLTKFKIGDIITHREKYIFQLEMLIHGHARASKVIFLDTNKAAHYEIYPQPICRLWSLYDNGRLATKEEVKRFNKEFSKDGKK